MEQHQKIIDEILDRNRRVEIDKAWETSWIRRLFLAGITYITATLFLWLIDSPYPYINACVPTGGYLLSTLSLPWIKRWWLRHRTHEGVLLGG